MQKKMITIALIFFSVLLDSCQPTYQVITPTQSVIASIEQTAATLVSTKIPLVTPEINSAEETNTLDIAYVKDNPVTDNQEIVLFLDNLLSRFFSQFSKSGWYYFPNDKQNSYWVHIPDLPSEGEFDMFLSTTQYHTYAPGFIWPFSIVLQDGSWGFSRLSPRLDDYQFDQSWKKSDVPLTLDNLDYFAGGANSTYFGQTSLIYFIGLLKSPNSLESNIDISRTFSGWVEQEDGKEVFVLLIHETYPGMKPQLESSRQVIDHRDQYTYFDMDNGGRMYEKYVDFLEGGAVVEDDLQFNQHLVQYYEVLPEDIQIVYDEAAQKLKDYLNE